MSTEVAPAPAPQIVSAPFVPTGDAVREGDPRSIEALVAAELPPGEAIRRGDEGARWLRHPPRDLFGIALSGGGIRSATFNLGLLQGLHDLQLLRAFDYLSTVSGGGYIGSFWTAWRSRRPGREGRFPCDIPEGAAEPREVRHLREFSNFLAPRLGIFSYDTGRLVVTGISAMLPSLLASLSVVALALFAWIGLAWLLFSPSLSFWASVGVLVALTTGTLTAFELAWRRRREPSDGAAYLGAALLSIVLTTAWWWALPGPLAPGAAYLAGQLLPGLEEAELTRSWAYVFAPAAAWGGAFLTLVALRWFFSLAVRWPRWQRVRRASDRARSRLLLLTVVWSALSLLWFAGLLIEYHLIGDAPAVAAPGLGGLGAALVAAFAQVQKLLSKQRNESAASSLLARIKPLLPQILAYAVLVMMVLGMVGLIVAAERPGGVLPFGAGAVLAGAVGITVLVLVLMDPNEVGLHSFYRSRLVRAYPGASNDGRPGLNREAEVVDGDDVRLDELGGGGLRPFPLVCCAANDLSSRDGLETLNRGASSAVLSPAGCSVDGEWAPWSDYRTAPTLGGAITASGAAFNTLMGSFSKQLGPAVTFVAAALNLRLGMWVPHPAHPGKRRIKLAGWPFYLEMFGLATASGPRPVHLSDGGHFENLAVYELIRRHCRVILAADCGADGDGAFDDLGNLVRKVREDFGVEVRIDTTPLRRGANGLSRQHMVAGDIHYPDGDTGVLLLCKPVLVGSEPADVQQYHTRNAGFPHESTGDQFYDEAQWESYRRLGQHSVHTAFRPVIDGLELQRPGRSDAELRQVWGDAFARARREWFPEPEGYDERLSRFADRVAELDAHLRQGECRLLQQQVYKELSELERQQRRVRVGDLAVVAPDADGVARVDTQPAEEDVLPSSEELAASLYVIRRALLLMEEVFQGGDLARNHGHPLYLGVMNWFARWAYAPLFRLWWPLLKTMYPQPLTRFLEQQFSLRSVERPDRGDLGEEMLQAVVRRGDAGFAGDCWRRQGRVKREDAATVLSYHLRMFYEGRGRYEIQAAQVSADAAVPGALIWEAEDFFVPPGLWGVGIGTEFLRALRGGPADLEGVSWLVVRVAYDPAAGAAGRKRAADEMHLYRASGFREADLVEGALHFGAAPQPLSARWIDRDGAETYWMVAAVNASPLGAAPPPG